MSTRWICLTVLWLSSRIFLSKLYYLIFPILFMLLVYIHTHLCISISACAYVFCYSYIIVNCIIQPVSSTTELSRWSEAHPSFPWISQMLFTSNFASFLGVHLIYFYLLHDTSIEMWLFDEMSGTIFSVWLKLIEDGLIPYAKYSTEVL